MVLCDLKNKFLFEARPDLFPEKYLTQVEMHLWDLFWDFKKEMTAKD